MNLRYADDATLLAESENDTRQMLTRVSRQDYQLHIPGSEHKLQCDVEL